MNEDIIDFEIPAEYPEELSRECHMSRELFLNARLTMGEIRDFMQASGMSWELLQQNIDRAQHSLSPIDKALDRMDDYSTGPGRSLHDKPSNIH